MSLRESEYQNIIIELRDDNERFRNQIAKEILVHEALGRKRDAYIEALRKELIIAQNLFKNPSLTQKLREEVGIERLEIYSYPKPS